MAWDYASRRRVEKRLWDGSWGRFRLIFVFASSCARFLTRSGNRYHWPVVKAARISPNETYALHEPVAKGPTWFVAYSGRAFAKKVAFCSHSNVTSPGAASNANGRRSGCWKCLVPSLLRPLSRQPHTVVLYWGLLQGSFGKRNDQSILHIPYLILSTQTQHRRNSTADLLRKRMYCLCNSSGGLLSEILTLYNLASWRAQDFWCRPS